MFDVRLKPLFIPLLILAAALISVLVGCGDHRQTSDTPTTEATVLRKVEIEPSSTQEASEPAPEPAALAIIGGRLIVRGQDASARVLRAKVRGVYRPGGELQRGVYEEGGLVIEVNVGRRVRIDDADREYLGEPSEPEQEADRVG